MYVAPSAATVCAAMSAFCIKKCARPIEYSGERGVTAVRIVWPSSEEPVVSDDLKLREGRWLEGAILKAHAKVVKRLK